MTTLTRRRFVQDSTVKLAAAGVATALVAPPVHAAGSDAIRVGLVGCGGRGTGAAAQAIKAGHDVRIEAMGDMFGDRLEASRKRLASEGGSQVQVPDEKCYVGIDAYKQVLASGVDAVLLATPPHFRPLHLEAAVAAGVHVFAEKPIAVDAPGVRRVLAACRAAEEKRLSIVSGLMLHYEPGMQQTVDRIHQGAVGDVVSLVCNYNIGGLWVHPRRPEWSDMEWQLRNWYYFTWLSGDHIVEQHVHCLDLMAWVMKGEYPLRAVGSGGRQARTDPQYGHIFDHHAVCYEFKSGVRCHSYCRQQDHTAQDISNWAFGAKGTANLLRRTITGAASWSYGSRMGRTPSPGPWGGHQEEQDALFAGIRSGRPINNGLYMAHSTLMAIMGRMATYTGQEITWEMALNSAETLGPERYEFGPLATPPVAVPGRTSFA